MRVAQSDGSAFTSQMPQQNWSTPEQIGENHKLRPTL